jgi:signal-transduction protein with cAMP-binding, CBS, and nucleotidyltransferase domain
MKTGYKVCDAMTEKPVTVSPDLSLQECAKIMSDRHVGAVLVHNKELDGIITEQDIVRKSVINNDKPSVRKASDIMETVMHTIGPEKDIYDALVHMKEKNIRHLPVVSNREMVGLLTLKDILKIEPQLFDLLVEKFELREEERKPINNQPEKEGVCQECGKYSDELVEAKGVLVCHRCAE